MELDKSQPFGKSYIVLCHVQYISRSGKQDALWKARVRWWIQVGLGPTVGKFWDTAVNLEEGMERKEVAFRE